MHISPETVEFLRTLNQDVVRVNEVLPSTASDQDVIREAAKTDRVVLTQDLDFSALVALSGARKPTIITLRLISSRVEHVNATLERVLPALTEDAESGALITVEDHGVRKRLLPFSS
jgi:predicted nuclease of predicted toxin-antitoxin system